MKSDNCYEVTGMKYCYNSSHNGNSLYDSMTGAKYGSNSKCFMSNVINLGELNDTKSHTAFKS